MAGSSSCFRDLGIPTEGIDAALLTLDQPPESREELACTIKRFTGQFYKQGVDTEGPSSTFCLIGSSWFQGVPQYTKLFAHIKRAEIFRSRSGEWSILRRHHMAAAKPM